MLRRGQRIGARVVVKNQKDFTVGLFYIAAGLAFSVLSRSYRMGSADAMGPGYFPFWLGLILALIGTLVAGRSLSARAVRERLPALRLSMFALVMGSILFFGAFVDYLGLVLTVAISVLIASAASHQFRLRNALVCALAVAVFCALLFVALLGLQIPLWPDLGGS